MTARESARNEWAKLKDRPWQEKARHLMTYYWGYFAAAAVLLGVVVVFTVNRLTAKEVVLYGFFAHAVAQQETAELYEQGFAESAGIDLNQFDIHIEANSDSVAGERELGYADGQILTVRIAGNTEDIFAADLSALITYAYGGYMKDLTQVVSPEQLAAWEPYLLYMDESLYREIERNQDSDAVYALPEPTEPETMETPIPFAVVIPADSELRKAYGFYCEDLAIGVLLSCANDATAAAFIDYALQ